MSYQKPKHHQALVVKIDRILPHNNADSLEIIHILGYQCVVKKGEFKIVDYGIYIFPDSVVPQTEPFKFIWEQYLTEPNGTCPEKRRRITVRKFRGEYSEGLLLPITDFLNEFRNNIQRGNTNGFPIKVDEGNWSITLKDGDDVSDLLGITHYNPPEPQNTGGQNESAPIARPKGFKGILYRFLNKFGIKIGSVTESAPIGLPVYDVEALKNYPNIFDENDEVVVTEKIHGSNARFTYMNGKMYAGSRTLWKSPKSNCVWRKALKQNPWIEKWCRNHEGFVLYGEIVPTQGSKFNYGCGSGEVGVFLFDILLPEGEWLDWKGIVYKTNTVEGLDLWNNWVPVLYVGKYDKNIINSLVSGNTSVYTTPKQIREGIVIRTTNEVHVVGLGRKQLKLVSPEFYLKDNS